MQSKWILGALATLTVLIGAAEASRILIIVPTVSRSHHIWNRVLVLALAKRGHQVTVLSPDPEKEPVPNYTHYNLPGSYERTHEVLDMEGMVENTALEMVGDIWKWGIEMCRHQSKTKGFEDLLKLPRDSFDLIIMEMLFNECMFVFIHHFGGGTRIPVIGMTAFGIGPWTDIATGARTMPSVFAFPVMPYLSHMNFWERLYNTAVTVYYTAGMHYYYLSEQQKTAEDAYGPVPPLHKLGENISLILVNNHYIINGPQAELPNIIEVGGMQCSPAKPLPKDIKTFLDESERGVVYFSLGTNLRSEVLPKERLQTILGTFTALGPKIRVLWKFDPKVPLENVPSNVMLQKWLPQEDVLGHPKVLAFVSHGGLLSTQESIYHGVPVVAVPFFVDQHTNAKRLDAMKVATRVDFMTMTKESFTQSILTVINDPSYRRNMQKISSLFRDQPENPLDRAIFWTEFAIRHNDNGRINNIRSAGIQLAWYQYFLLDVVAFIFLVILLALYMVMFVIKSLCRMLFGTGSKRKSAKNSKKRR